MRVSFEPGAVPAEPETRERAARTALLYLGRFAPLLTSVAIRAEPGARSGEVCVQVSLVLRDQNVQSSQTSAVGLDAAVERALARAARSLSALVERRKI